MIITHDTLDLTVRGPSHLLVTSGGLDWRPVQICSLEDFTVQAPSSADIWWLANEAHTVGE